MQDMSSAEFPAIPRKPVYLAAGWNNLVNKNGAAGAAEVLADVFTVKLPGNGEEAVTDAGPERNAESGDGADCG